MKRFFGISLLFTLLAVQAWAAEVSERVYLSTDKDVYVAGDIIWCSAFCFDGSGSLSSASSIAYVEVASVEGVVATAKIGLIDGRGSGSVAIPLSAPTGNYRIIAYTSSGKGRPDLETDGKTLSVFNTLSARRVSKGVDLLPDDEYQRTPAAAKAVQGRVSVSCPSALPSSSVKVLLENGETSVASLSLSVFCDDGIVSPSDASIVKFASGSSSWSAEAVDLDGEVFHGHLVGTKKTDVLANQFCSAVIAFPGRATDIYMGKFNPDGTVDIKTLNVYGNHDLVCEILGQKEDSDCRLVIESPFLRKTPSELPTLGLCTGLEDALVRRSLAVQNDRIAATDTLFEFLPKRESVLLSDTYCVSYHLDDYDRFPTVRETLIEITPNLRVRKGPDGKLQMQMLLKDVDAFSSNVLTLIDGVPVKDIASLLDFDCMLFGDILVYPYTYSFGSAVFQGVVDFVTTKGDISSFKFDRNVEIVEWQGASYPVAYTCQGLLPSEDRDSAADLRGTLYWHPSLSITAGGRMEVEVKTPSYPGTFRVVAEGVTSEGKPFRTETTLTVSR